MKKENISFAISPNVGGVAKIPEPTKKYIPKWYKDIPLYEHQDNGLKNITAKACIPFLDTITSGYIFELWTDIEVENKNNITSFDWAQKDWPLVHVRDTPSMRTIPERPHHHPFVFAIQHPLYIKTPPGYSVLISSPFNRLDLPIKVLTGVIDTDKNPIHPGKIPFEMSIDFEGIIKAGTPLFQILPFKRTAWKSKEDQSIITEAEKTNNKIKALFYGGYKGLSWSKKEYL